MLSGKKMPSWRQLAPSSALRSEKCCSSSSSTFWKIATQKFCSWNSQVPEATCHRHIWPLSPYLFSSASCFTQCLPHPCCYSCCPRQSRVSHLTRQQPFVQQLALIAVYVYVYVCSCVRWLTHSTNTAFVACMCELPLWVHCFCSICNCLHPLTNAQTSPRVATFHSLIVFLLHFILPFLVCLAFSSFPVAYSFGCTLQFIFRVPPPTCCMSILLSFRFIATSFTCKNFDPLQRTNRPQDGVQLL